MLQLKKHFSSKLMQDKNILQIMNVPYCPEFNAIELYWARAKKLFRSKITDIKIKGEEVNLVNLVSECISLIHPDEIERMGKSSIKLLNQREEEYKNE